MAAVGVSMLLVGIAVTVNLGASVENKKTLQGVADAAALQAEKTVRAAQASSSTAMVRPISRPWPSRLSRTM